MYEHRRRDFLARAICAAGAISMSGASAQTVLAAGEQELEFQSRGVTLSGVLVFPAGPPAAAIVLVHGSGKEERMLRLARMLAKDGFAVLTYDKRGVGKSGGTYEGNNNVGAENLNLLADDAAAALKELQINAQLRDIPQGFVGVSQAGWIIPLAAVQSPAAKFIGLWSGPVCTTSEQLHFQNWAQQNTGFWKSYSKQDVAEYMQSAPVRPDAVDPCISLRKLSVPGLWLYGDQDNLVPVDLSVARLQRLKHDDFEYEIFAGYGHNIVYPPASPAYARMVTWIKKTIRA